MRVLIIDPWCNDNQDGYMFGLAEGLSDKVDLTLCSNYYESKKIPKLKLLPIFFKYSEKMQRSKIRSIIRGLEYIYSYLRIFCLVKKNKFDVIHIEWALQYKVDAIFGKILKTNCNKFIYTAHNVIPHVAGKKYISDLKIMYRNFDIILVHGETIRKEFFKFFPEEKEKVKIQRHGIYLTQKTQYVYDNVDQQLKAFVDNTKGKIVVCVGHVFYNKGTDRVIKYWLKHENGTKNKLIVAGQQAVDFEELEKLIPSITKTENILYLSRFLNEDEFNFLCFKSDIITIPYRHASMSGVVFSAAAFSKPIVYTDTGSIREYVGEDSCFCSLNNDTDFEKEMLNALNYSSEALMQEGIKLHNHIYENYSWENIAKHLVEEIYV